MRKVVVDTDILIDHLRGMKRAKEIILKIRRREVIGYISAVTEAELISGEECRKLDKKREVKELIDLFTKINVSNKIAEKAGDFRRDYGTPLIDSLIAATAFYQKAVIWTRNLKHYKKIEEVKTKEPF